MNVLKIVVAILWTTTNKVRVFEKTFAVKRPAKAMSIQMYKTTCEVSTTHTIKFQYLS